MEKERQSASALRDKHGGVIDPVNEKPDGNWPLPEGLERERKGPLNKDTGRRPKKT
jgi:hypothetical protein